MCFTPSVLQQHCNSSTTIRELCASAKTCDCMQAIRLPHVYRVQAYSLYRIPGLPKAISFSQAAGGHEAIYGLPLPRMCIAFCSAHGIDQMRSQHALCARQSLAIFNSCVSATLVPFQGYRCKERNGVHMLAFYSVRFSSWPRCCHQLQ